MYYSMNKIRKKKKKKFYNNDDFEKEKLSLHDQVLLHHDKLLLPSYFVRLKSIKTDSCFDLLSYTQTDNNLICNDVQFNITPPEFKPLIRTIKIDMLLNQSQQLIFHTWFDATMLMYNKTIEYIKKNFNIESLHEIKRINKLCYALNDKLTHLYKDVSNLIKNKKKLLTKLKNKYNKKKKTSIDLITINILMKDIIDHKNKITCLNILIHNLNSDYNKYNLRRNKLDKHIDHIFDHTHTRTYVLKSTTEDILLNSQTKLFNYDTKIKTHMLNAAVKQASAAFKSAKENFLNGHNKKFRVRYWRPNRINKIIEIGAEYILEIEKDSEEYNLCPHIFGPIKYRYDGEEYKLEKKTVKIHYEGSTGRFRLLVPEDLEAKKRCKNGKYIGIDAGIRTPFTGISNNELIKIGKKLVEMIRMRLIMMDNIMNNPDIPERSKYNKIEKYTRIIKDRVVEMHWKVINYLTENYDIIIIGKLEMSKILRSKKIDKMTKRIGSALNHYKFLERLIYKAKTKGVEVEVVNESFTTKTCSNCGHYKEELEGEEVYNCDEYGCLKKIDRDVNGSRNIMIKRIKKEEI
ncbi:MAG: transposase [Edafosvirus sp.]|uniref:Transposase n=1 Tax=Edafosvirus sp. TaxID=2487765 RepID=A0A3G4ZWK6_9VIRU|nr:MAG: transposase [Edafosvirus sp.]